ncbi:unnamed protein product, partial [Heterotrigona itama]
RFRGRKITEKPVADCTIRWQWRTLVPFDEVDAHKRAQNNFGRGPAKSVTRRILLVSHGFENLASARFLDRCLTTMEMVSMESNCTTLSTRFEYAFKRRNLVCYTIYEWNLKDVACAAGNATLQQTIQAEIRNETTCQWMAPPMYKVE